MEPFLRKGAARAAVSGSPQVHTDSSALSPFVRRVPLPPISRVRRTHIHSRLDDPVGVARRETARVLGVARREPGPVGVAVGSRGITNLCAITAGVIAELRANGWAPFVIPAMGSHGGGSPDGQLSVLEGLGITEESVGAPLLATRAVECLGEVGGVRVFLDPQVLEAGAVLVINRVKPHTDFHGAVESGPAKMLAVGLGHLAGAAELHAGGPTGLRAGIPVVARHLAAQGLVLGAIAILENEVGETALVRGLIAPKIGSEEEEQLLEVARSMMPELPFEELDVLVVEQLGKDVSGEGVDPNVVGRMYITGTPEPETPHIRCIAALSLTDASAGNALGIGLTDFVSARLRRKIDFGALYANALTSGIVDVRRAKLPIVLPTDRLTIQAAIACCGRRDATNVRLCVIRDTKHLDLVGASPALLPEVAGREDFAVTESPGAMRFDADGVLQSLRELEEEGQG